MNVSLQKKLKSLLKKLNNDNAYKIYPLINQKYIPYKKRTVLLFRALQLIPTLLLGLFFLTHSGGFIFALSIAIMLNLIIHYRSKMISFVFSDSIPQLYNLLRIAEILIKIPEIKQIKPDIPEALRETNGLKKRLSIFRFDMKMESDLLVIAWAINEFFRIFFLIEPIGLNNIFIRIEKGKNQLKQVFSFIGLTDSLQSIAEARQKLPYYCIPDLSETKNEVTMNAIDMYHPLISDCVSNSFLAKDKSFLVLGSNMSGKTSFTRMVGVNLIIAQTLNICFAKHFSLKKCKVHSLLSVHDDLLQGKSYYLSEVLRMKEIITETEKGNHLILLDELFKGTNTVERIAAAKAVLDYLTQNKGNTIVAATHDTELVPLLSSNYIPLYFTENIQDNKLSFNYKISTKPNMLRNAIRILRLYDYPETIVQNALNLTTNS